MKQAGYQYINMSLMVRLDRPGRSNVLQFSADGDLTRVIRAINVEAPGKRPCPSM